LIPVRKGSEESGSGWTRWIGAFFVGIKAARWVFSERGQFAALGVVCQKELKNTVIAAKNAFYWYFCTFVGSCSYPLKCRM
jgi:hypothetical protein